MQPVTKPDYEDVVREINVFQTLDRPGRMKLQEIGRSVQGRPIPALLLTDPRRPAADKQHVFLVASQHGSEESGRAMILECVRFLLSDDAEAAAILQNMVVAVVPCANPDGAMAHTYNNANNVDIAHTFWRDRPAETPEGRALEDFVNAFVPDVYMDIHGMAGGSMKDRVWLIPSLPFGADGYFLTEIAAAMHRAAEAAGFPQMEVMPPGPFRGDQEKIYLLGDKIAGQFKALCMGMESIEHYYREPEWRAAGLVRLRALLREGLQDRFGLGVAGFPNHLVSGSRICGLMAHGTTAAARRESRIALTRFLRNNFTMVDRGSDGVDGCARVEVSSKTIHGDNPDRFAILLRIKKPCQVTGIEWNGERLSEDLTHGYRMWEDGNSVLVQASLKTPFGGAARHLIVRYASPYLPQSTPA